MPSIAVFLLCLWAFLMIAWISVELFRSLRSLLQRHNPVYQETCWLCHRVLGEDVFLYHLAKNTHRIICPCCAKKKTYSDGVEFYPDQRVVTTYENLSIVESEESNDYENVVNFVSSLSLNGKRYAAEHRVYKAELDRVGPCIYTSFQDVATTKLIMLSLPALRVAGIVVSTAKRRGIA